MVNGESEGEGQKKAQNAQSALSIDLKKVKEEILRVAFKATPDPAIVERNDGMDFALHQYFNSNVRKIMTPNDAIYVLHANAEMKKEGAQISEAEVKQILDKYSGHSPG